MKPKSSKEESPPKTQQSEKKTLQNKLEECQNYCDRLAALLPVGGLPQDLKNLREANTALAIENFEAKRSLQDLHNAINSLFKTLTPLLNHQKRKKNKKRAQKIHTKTQKIHQLLSSQPKKTPNRPSKKQEKKQMHGH